MAEWDLRNTRWNSPYFFDEIVKTDAGTIRKTWEVKDHWKMEETTTFTEGTDSFWFTNDLIYTGDYISSALEYNGDSFGSFKLETSDDLDYYDFKKFTTLTPSGERLQAQILFDKNPFDTSLYTDVYKDGCEDVTDKSCAVYSSRLEIENGGPYGMVCSGY